MALSETLSENNTLVKKTCRVCILPGKNMTNIFLAKSNDIVDKLLFCSGVTFREVPGYPSQICNKCVFFLSIASKFKTACLRSEENLKKLLQNRVNEENISINSNDSNDVCDLNDNDSETEKSVNQNIHTGESACIEVKSKECKLQKSSTKLLVKNSENIRVAVQKKKQKEIISIQNNPLPILQCRQCDTSFKTREELIKHKRKFHDEGRVCEVCGKYYWNATSMYRHLSGHSSQKLQCNYCSYETPSKQDLDKHIRIHMGLKEYRCDQCSCAFYTSSNLNIHIRRHHLKYKAFACTMCDKKFYDRTKLKIHLDGHNAIKRFECDVCHSRFLRRCQWKNHLLKHHSIVLPPLKPGPKPHDDALQKLFISDNKESGHI